ncbi:hypothetical protein J5N97_019546 [Dioscorea zingiberensis]|uniref:Uncharacterized protein n=1 Tax=Dioscorea zingiberensis TaxID=325984 RepID=A0A9D5CE23_9LILI|nr:hypothetical protein J5N97_019546 [Dioscorea zingiberensis]
MKAHSLISVFRRSITTYWSRTKNPKLKSSNKVVRLGGARSKRGFRFKIKVRLSTRFLTRFREAYVDVMLKIARRGVFSFSDRVEPIWNRRIPTNHQLQMGRSDIEKRLCFEIYKSFVLSGDNCDDIEKM